MVCAKADMSIARMYVERLAPHAVILDELEAEFERTVVSVLAIRGREHLLVDQPQLQNALSLRDPYLDPLSLLEVSLLSRKREAAGRGEDTSLIDKALGSTLNGIAQGLRNTG
jgi:phosphoenolpyruvate carboxylase